MGTGQTWVRTRDNQLIRGDAIERIRLSDDQRELLTDTRGGLNDLPIVTYPQPPSTERMLKDQRDLADLITRTPTNPQSMRIIYAEIIDGGADWRILAD
jgi:hypothetical protein